MPRSSSAACSAAAPGWEGSHAPHAGHVVHRAQPVDDREHPGPGRGGGGRRPAEPAHLPGQDHRPPGCHRAGYAQCGRREHRGHRADPPGRGRRRGGPRRGPAAPPVPRPRPREGEVLTGLVVWTVVDVLLLVAGLAFYLFWVGTLLTRIAGNLEECAETVRTIVGHAKLIGPGVGHINETGGVVAGALPLLYGMAEEIVTDVTPRPEQPAVPEPARPASGTRRSRLLDSVGFVPQR